MEKMIINKELLNNYKTFLIVLENCDVYEIGVDNILDVYCEAELIDKNKNEYRTTDGFIKISANAMQTVKSYVAREGEMNTEYDIRLKERLEICGNCADMTVFSLRDKNDTVIDIYVPYDPIESIINGSELDFSNCPSWHTDKDGNMIICFGESSKQPKRKDNNYADLIAGWKDTFGEREPKVLKVKIDMIYAFGQEQLNFNVAFKNCDKFSKWHFAELVFKDCQDVFTQMIFPIKGYCDIVMSKMSDRRIYVGFDGLGVEFTCASVFEYGYYCEKNKE